MIVIPGGTTLKRGVEEIIGKLEWIIHSPTYKTVKAAELKGIKRALIILKEKYEAPQQK